MNVFNVNKYLKMLKEVHLEVQFVLTRLMPHFDHYGYQIVITIFLASQKSSKYSKKYMQFDTIRKIRTTYLNYEKLSVKNYLIYR